MSLKRTILAGRAAIAFDGLPEYYGMSGIYADGDGMVYLSLSWLFPWMKNLIRCFLA